MPKAENMTESQLENVRKGQFKPGQSGNPSGRKKNRVKAFICNTLPKGKLRKMTGFTEEEINTIERSVFEMQLEDLKVMAGNEETPAYMKDLCRAIMTDMKNGKTTTFDKLRDRQYGIPQQMVDLTTNGKALVCEQSIDMDRLTKEQRDLLLSIGTDIINRKE